MSVHRQMTKITASRVIRLLLLGASAVFFALHFVHLTADFPNHSPWMDWSKYTDEGWYGDAAIRHFVSGHWYWKGDFNPAVALPVWPAIELLVFKFTGVSVTAARALTLGVFGFTLVTLYLLIQRATRPRGGESGDSLAAPIAIFFLCTSPFIFVFERMAILEPLLIALTALGLLIASDMEPIQLQGRRLRGLGSRGLAGIRAAGAGPHKDDGHMFDAGNLLHGVGARRIPAAASATTWSAVRDRRCRSLVRVLLPLRSAALSCGLSISLLGECLHGDRS